MKKLLKPLKTVSAIFYFTEQGHNTMEKILIIEDDTDLREGLSFSLEMEGYTVDGAASLSAGKKLLKETSYDFLLLDCNLPDGSGFEFCREFRKKMNLPILMLTARDTELDEVKALELGADDYMAKPFSLAVLKARIRKLLLKTQAPQLLESGGIAIDRENCKVIKNQTELSLSPTEYKLLLYLVEHKNKVLSKEQILQHIWDTDRKYVDDNTVSVNIRRLRKKIERDAANPEYLKTIHGIGYLWKEDSR